MIETMPEDIKTIRIIPSKSFAHRAYICDFLKNAGNAGIATIPGSTENVSVPGDASSALKPNEACVAECGGGIICDLDSDDVNATRSCIEGLRCGAGLIDVQESGSTLRFIIPLAGVLGRHVTIKTHGRLSERPMGPFEDELIAHGMTIEHRRMPQPENSLPDRINPPEREDMSQADNAEVVESTGIIEVSGQLRPGTFRLPGSISSQFITGLLLSLPYLDGDSEIQLTSPLQSSAYVDITVDVLREYGIEIETIHNEADDYVNAHSETEMDVGAHSEAESDMGAVSETESDEGADAGVDPGTAENAGIIGYKIRGGQKYCRSTPYTVEGDWSQTAFWLAAGAIGKAPVRVEGLNIDSVQGDRKIVDVLRKFGARIEIGTSDLGSSPNDRNREENIDKNIEETINHSEGFALAYPSRLHGTTVDVSEIPDLAPAIACTGAAACGETKLVNAGRLRLKESDRIKSIVKCLNDVGVRAEEGEDEIIIHGCGVSLTVAGRDCVTKPAGGIAETAGDHRIVMMAAVMALITSGKVTIAGSGAVSKSYPTFFQEMEKAGLMTNCLI